MYDRYKYLIENIDLWETWIKCSSDSTCIKMLKTKMHRFIFKCFIIISSVMEINLQFIHQNLALKRIVVALLSTIIISACYKYWSDSPTKKKLPDFAYVQFK